MNEKIKLLKNVGLFSKLQKHELEVVAQYSEYCSYGKGDFVFQEGTSDEELFIIKEGEVVITKKTEEQSTDLARFIKGECFGELDLLDDTPRNTSAIAESDSVLLIFPMRKTPFRSVLQKHPDIFSQILHKLLIMIAGRIRSTNKLVSERTPWIEDLRKQLLIDKLTGLYNRTYLAEDLPALLPRMGEKTSLVVIKPDNFKYINDNFGHDTGDRVLRLLADTVKNSLRENEIGVRYRGNEFVIVLPDTGPEPALQRGEDFRAAVSELNIAPFTEEKLSGITASVGSATYPIHAENVEGIVERAFKLMQEVLNSGGDRVLG